MPRTCGAGGLRLLVVVALTGAAFWAVWTGRIRGASAAGALAIITVGDLWTIDRRFFDFKPPAAELFADDPVTSVLRQEPPPFRVLDAGVYPGAVLMASRIQTVLGYHGVEVRYYDELLGGKNEWRNLGNPTLHDLLAVRYLVLPDTQTVPGFQQVAGPVATNHGATAVLYRRDTAPDYVRIVPAAAKLPDDQLVPTVLDPRFPRNGVVVVSDTASLSPAPIRTGGADTTAVRATLAEWKPGDMRVTLSGSDTRPTYLLVSETWYKDWVATIDGKPAPVYRGDHALLMVEVPPGAREVSLRFESPEYARGKLVSLLALIAIAGLYGGTLAARRRGAHV